MRERVNVFQQACVVFCAANQWTQIVFGVNQREGRGAFQELTMQCHSFELFLVFIVSTKLTLL